MSLQERVRARLTDDQRKTARAFLDVVKYPLRKWRSAVSAWKLPSLPGGRPWRSSIPMRLLYSFQRGLIGYRYRGIPMIKHPVDIALYMRLIWETRPATIIEIGSDAGGTALWLADLVRAYGSGARVVSIDIKPPAPIAGADNLEFLPGDANDLGRTLTPERLASFQRPFLVIEDASHRYAHSLSALRFFAPLMRAGEYIIVEDANFTEMGMDAGFDGGPARAIAEFLRLTAGRFEIDADYCDWFGTNVTANTNGYLRCVR